MDRPSPETALPNRRSMRLPGFDYARTETYFVTVCAHRSALLFGAVEGETVLHNRFGEAVRAAWEDLPNHYCGWSIDAFVVMPNHMHGILSLTDAFTQTHVHEQPVALSPDKQGPKPGMPYLPHALPEVVRGFKSFSAKRINELRGTAGAPVWQRGYFDHIIRDQRSLVRIQRYIAENPARWDRDRYNR